MKKLDDLSLIQLTKMETEQICGGKLAAGCECPGDISYFAESLCGECRCTSIFTAIGLMFS